MNKHLSGYYHVPTIQLCWIVLATAIWTAIAISIFCAICIITAIQVFLIKY